MRSTLTLGALAVVAAQAALLGGLATFAGRIHEVSAAIRPLEGRTRAEAVEAHDYSLSLSLEDELSILYSTRMPIDATGMPEIAVGLMDDQNEVTFRTAGPVEIVYHALYEGQRVKKSLHFPEPGEFRAVLDKGTPAVVTHFPLLETVPHEAAREARLAVESWGRRGHPAKLIEVGAVNGIKGRVLDNRKILIVADGPGDADWAEKLRQDLFRNDGLQTGLHETLVEMPKGTVRFYRGRDLLFTADALVEILPEGDAAMTVLNVEHDRGYKWHGFEDRSYAGRLLITPDRKGKLALVNMVRVVEYLKSVVPMEVFPSAPPEALKAQAIAAAGHVLAQVGSRHLADPYHLCAEQHCQMYGGRAKEKASTTQAVLAAKGQLLFRGDKVVDTVYSALSGGHTENNEVAWAQAPDPSLRGKPDLFGKTSFVAGINDRNIAKFLSLPVPGFALSSSLVKKDKYRWKRVIPAAKATELTKALGTGDVTALKVLGRGISGRVRAVQVVGTQRTAVVQYEFPVRKLFDGLPSGLFTVEAVGTGAARKFVFSGAGWGHGVGMCQTGAVGRAEKGQKYDQILRHYYSDAELRTLY
jgi:stage II sporulation protein D